MNYSSRYKVISCNCEDYSNTKYAGKYYVYCWLDENGKPFYVGSGSGNRASSVSKRSDAFKHHLNQKCSIYMVAENVARHVRFTYECYLTRFLIKYGYSLVNKAYSDLEAKYGLMFSDVVTEDVKKRLIDWIENDHNHNK